MIYIRIIIASDNHYDLKILHKIAQLNPTATHYLHCGDSQAYPKDILPFVSVRGNNDLNKFPATIKVKLNEYYTILLIHGHTLDHYDLNKSLHELANENNSNIIAFGHTHYPMLTQENGIYFLNPGSTTLPRGGSHKSYAIIEIDGEEISFKHMSI